MRILEHLGHLDKRGDFKILVLTPGRQRFHTQSIHREAIGNSCESVLILLEKRLRGAGVHEAGASGLGLGDLFARACETLSVPPPPDELLGALNSDQPRQALEIFIAAGTQQPSSAAATSTAVATSTAAVPDARNLLAQDSCTPDQLARIIAQLTLSGRNPDALQAKLTQELANLEQRASQRQDCRRHCGSGTPASRRRVAFASPAHRASAARTLGSG